jgi:hypothetical protein
MILSVLQHYVILQEDVFTLVSCTKKESVKISCFADRAS